MLDLLSQKVFMSSEGTGRQILRRSPYTMSALSTHVRNASSEWQVDISNRLERILTGNVL